MKNFSRLFARSDVFQVQKFETNCDNPWVQLALSVR